MRRLASLGKTSELLLREVRGRDGIGYLVASFAEGAACSREAFAPTMLESIAPAIPLLVRFLRRDDMAIRMAVAGAMGALPEASAGFVEALEAALARETDEEVSEVITEVLEKIRGARGAG